MVLYADFSHHDWDRVKGEFDWSAIRRATSSVLCLRATYGDPSRYAPPTYHFVDMAEQARSEGFSAIGGYHNLISGDQASINRQVDFFRRELDKAGSAWAMLDVERYDELLSNGLWPRMDDVQQFCDRWHSVESRVLTVYLPKWVWQASMNSADLRPLRCPIVASDYGTNGNGTPAAVYSARGGDQGRGWGSYGNVAPTIWQFGSNVDCPGASGQTDVNAFRGTEEQLINLLGGDGMPTAQEIADVVWNTRIVNQAGVAAAAKTFLGNGFMRTVAIHEASIAAAEAAGVEGKRLEELKGQLSALQTDLENVDEEVAKTLGVQAQEDPAEVARILKAALGGSAEAVFRAGLGQDQPTQG